VNTFRKVLEPLARVSIASLVLADGKLFHRAGNAHEEDIVWPQEVDSEGARLRKLDHMIDDEILALQAFEWVDSRVSE